MSNKCRRYPTISCLYQLLSLDFKTVYSPLLSFSSWAELSKLRPEHRRRARRVTCWTCLVLIVHSSWIKDASQYMLFGVSFSWKSNWNGTLCSASFLSATISILCRDFHFARAGDCKMTWAFNCEDLSMQTPQLVDSSSLSSSSSVEANFYTFTRKQTTSFT